MQQPGDQRRTEEVLGAISDELCNFCHLPLRGEGGENCAHCPHCHRNYIDECDHIVAISYEEAGDPPTLLNEDFVPPMLPPDMEFSLEELSDALGDFASLAEVYYDPEMANMSDLLANVMEHVPDVEGYWVGGLGNPVEWVFYARDQAVAAAQVHEVLDQIQARFDQLATRN